MAPKSKKQQNNQDDADKDAIRTGPQVQWLVRDPATNPLVPCPRGRCYSTAAIHDGRMYVFGGWNGMGRTEALKAKNIANLNLGKNMLNITPAPVPTPTLHVPAPPSSAPAGGKKKASNANADGGKSPSVANLAQTVTQGSYSPNATPAINNLFGGSGNTNPNNNSGIPIHSISHPCHENTILCYDIGTSAWSVVDSVLGEPHPGTSQGSIAELGGAVMLFGGWDGYRRHNALTLFSQTEDRWKPYNTNPDNAPPPLCFHAMCGYGRKLFIFGGEFQEGINPDLYVLDLTSLNWSVAPTAGIPVRRTSHTMTVVQGLYVVVFGGRNAEGVALNDVNIFDINSNHWVVGIKTIGVGPARYGHSAVTVTERGILIYGGMGPKVGLPVTPAVGATKGDKAAEKDREAQQAAATANAVGSYEMQSDVWLLTVGEKMGTVSWERCPVGTSTDLAPLRGASPARSVGSLGDASSSATPIPPDHPNNNKDGTITPTYSNLGASTSRIGTPIPGVMPPLGNAPPPQARCGHTAVMQHNVMYIFGGRTDSMGTVCKDIGVLDVSAILPPVSVTPMVGEGRDTRMESDSGMRAPSSALTN